MWLKHSLISYVESVGKCIVTYLWIHMYNKTRYNDKIVYLYINSTYSYHTLIFNFLKVISETYTKYIVIYLQSLPRRTPAWLLYKYIKCVLQCELRHSGDRTRKSGASGSIFCDAPPNDHFYQTCFEPLSQMLMVLLFVMNRHIFFFTRFEQWSQGLLVLLCFIHR